MREYKEKDLESFIEAYLLKSGYIKRESKDYDKSLGLDKKLLKDFYNQLKPKSCKS